MKQKEMTESGDLLEFGLKIDGNGM